MSNFRSRRIIFLNWERQQQQLQCTNETRLVERIEFQDYLYCSLCIRVLLRDLLNMYWEWKITEREISGLKIVNKRSDDVLFDVLYVYTCSDPEHMLKHNKSQISRPVRESWMHQAGFFNSHHLFFVVIFSNGIELLKNGTINYVRKNFETFFFLFSLSLKYPRTSLSSTGFKT